MKITVAKERILYFPAKITVKDAQLLAWEKKLSSFGTLNQMATFLSRPKDEDFELTYTEHRYEPFWHVATKAYYVYDRNAKYQVPASAEEVKSIKLLTTNYEVTNGHFHVPVTEHCVQEEQEEVFVDGISGQNSHGFETYLSLSPQIVNKDLEKSLPKGSILVPPQVRVSALMRDALAKMIKGIQADKILEEKVEVTCVDLYYHPIYAFQYRWKTKGKEAIVEVNGLTGTTSTGKRTFSEYLGKVLDRDFLFDVGADAASIFIPGGGIAVKVAKKYLETKRHTS